MKDSPNLDALRSVAVLMVVVTHAPAFLPGNFGAGHLAGLGRMGVIIFFVHTTLVLMLSMQRNGAAPGPFFVRRAFRIYPLSMATVLALAAICWLIGKPVPAAEVFSNLLLTQHITGHRSWPHPLWSLPYEVAMYLVLPALFVFLRGRNALARAFGLCVGSIALAAALYSPDRLLVALIPCFLPGALAFVLMRGARPQAHPAALFALVAAFAVPVTIAADPMPWLWALCLSLGLSIPFCREIRWRPATVCAAAVAKYSYGVYLTHILVLTVAQAAPTWWARVAVYLVVQAGLAVLAYRIIEAPGIRLGVRMAERIGRLQAQKIPQPFGRG